MGVERAKLNSQGGRNLVRRWVYFVVVGGAVVVAAVAAAAVVGTAAPAAAAAAAVSVAADVLATGPGLGIAC